MERDVLCIGSELGHVISFLLSFFKNWSIVDLQCCPSFRCTAEWFSWFFSIIGYYKMQNIVVVHVYKGILFNHKKEWNTAILSNTDRPSDYHTKWSKSERESQVLYDIAYMWNLHTHKIQMCSFAKQKIHRHRNKHCYQKEKGGRINWKFGVNRYTPVYVRYITIIK